MLTFVVELFLLAVLDTTVDGGGTLSESEVEASVVVFVAASFVAEDPSSESESSESSSSVDDE